LRDVAYSQIPRAARGERHRGAAAWIESLGRPEDHAEMLAHHYLSALEYARATGRDDPALAKRARVALRAAGDHALALASYGGAARFSSAALERWPHNDPDRIRVLVQTGRARYGADQMGTDLLKEGVKELEARGDCDEAAEVAVDLARALWLRGESDAASAYVDRALHLTEAGRHQRARAHALVERAAYHMHASEHARAIHFAREALPLTETLGMDELRVRALDVLASSRVCSGDPRGLEDSQRAIALARQSSAFYRLVVAQFNRYFQCFFLGQLTASWEVLSVVRRDVEAYGTADQRIWARVSQAHEAFLKGRWDEADEIVNELISGIEAGAVRHILDPVCMEVRAAIALARGHLQGASADSRKALERARRTKEPQLLASALAVRAMALLAQALREEASELAAEVLARGSVLIPAMLELHPVATPIELAWLVRDLRVEADFLAARASAPASPWLDAASAIVKGDFARGVELVTHLEAPTIEAYTRLRAAEAMTAAGNHTDARGHLEPALAFYRSVGATRYIREAESLLATSA